MNSYQKLIDRIDYFYKLAEDIENVSIEPSGMRQESLNYLRKKQNR